MVPVCSQPLQTVGYKENNILKLIQNWACHSQHKIDLPIQAILTTAKDLKAIMTIVHLDTVKLGYVTFHRAFYCKTIMAELPLLILPLCLLQRQRKLITMELELSKLLFTIQ